MIDGDRLRQLLERYPGHSYQVDTVTEEYTSLYEPDPTWEFVDVNGHTHRYDGNERVTTARWFPTSEYWCEDCRDLHQTGAYFCLRCGASVAWPGTRASVRPRVMLVGYKGTMEFDLREGELDGGMFTTREGDTFPIIRGWYDTRDTHVEVSLC